MDGFLGTICLGTEGITAQSVWVDGEKKGNRSGCIWDMLRDGVGIYSWRAEMLGIFSLIEFISNGDPINISGRSDYLL